MKLDIDANLVISALNADSKARELIVTLVPDLLTPAFAHDEIENSEDLIAEKSGMDPDRVAQFIDLLFQYVEVVPAEKCYPEIETAERAIGDTDLSASHLTQDLVKLLTVTVLLVIIRCTKFLTTRRRRSSSLSKVVIPFVISLKASIRRTKR